MTPQLYEVYHPQLIEDELDRLLDQSLIDRVIQQEEIERQRLRTALAPAHQTMAEPTGEKTRER